MVPRRASTAILLGLVVSLALHMSVLLPGLVQIMKGEVRPINVLRTDFDPDDFAALRDPNEVELGIEESDVPSMTWIGFEDYQKHMAALAEVEQAAFQTEPTGSEPTPAGPTTETPPTQEQEPAPEQPTSPDPFDELEAWFDAPEGEGPPIGEPTNAEARAQAVEDIIERLEQMMENPVEATEPAPRPQPEQEQPAVAQPTQPQPAGRPGAQSDQESDATSLNVTMEQLTLGRPLASQGLQLKPRKPVFTTLTLLTAVPANPLAELRFRRDGKPSRVRLLESSGDPRIDEAVLNSLYRWRAAGKRLRELQGRDTIPIRIRIMLR